MGAPAAQNNFTKYFVHEYGLISANDTRANHDQMIAEIAARGPIARGVCARAFLCVRACLCACLSGGLGGIG